MKFSYFALCAILGAGVISSATADSKFVVTTFDESEIIGTKKGTILKSDTDKKWWVPMNVNSIIYMKIILLTFKMVQVQVIKQFIMK